MVQCAGDLSEQISVEFSASMSMGCVCIYVLVSYDVETVDSKKMNKEKKNSEIRVAHRSNI